MPTLPAQVDGDRRLREALAARAVLDPARSPGVFVCGYWRGANPAVAAEGGVSVKIAHWPAEAAAADRQTRGIPAGGIQHRRSKIMIEVAAIGPDETTSNGITGNLGGIVDLRPQDIFLVPPRAIGLAGGDGPAEGVIVRVKDGTVSRVAGHWIAEVSGS